MIHVFEHLPHPARVLRTLRALIREGGLLAIDVPNLRYPLAHLDPILGTDLGGYFTLRSLSRLVASSGFEVVARDSRLLAYGRKGLVGAIDSLISVPCRWFGGLGSNIAVLGRKAHLD